MNEVLIARLHHLMRQATQERSHFYVENCAELAAAALTRADAIEKAAREVNAVERLGNRIDSGESWRDESLAMDELDFRRRKPLAWAALRAALDLPVGK